ncbi:hypothetical protein AAFF_G00022290 [Aldrovandia affinis]|uniref:Ig-like domain-containing protein n=1 Tax=Aldrovandia affinis TaxID=143900 RepID=A0AAD7R312_9TELE|nr:hypothetical protein AAFF_G00022290 [Aldrovandia affinis]
MAGTLCNLVISCCLLSDALCSDWSVWMPRSIEALHGSCVLIPCAFEVHVGQRAKLKRPVNGVWRKGSQWFQGSIIQGEIVGDLMQKNCTTILDNIPINYTDNYYFRIESGFNFTFATAVAINVIASPPKPWVTPMSEVSEGTPLNLTCSAPAPCPRLPPTLTWAPPGLGDSVDRLLANPDGTKSASSTLSFTASRLYHHWRIACGAVYPLQLGGGSMRAEDAVILNVLYSPENTSALLSPSGWVPKGTNITLTCTSDGNPQVAHYTWFRARGSEVTAVGWEKKLTFSMAEDLGGLYLCEAQNPHGRQNSTTVQLTVKGVGVTLWMWGVMVGGALLLCSLLTLCMCRLRKSSKLPAIVSKGLSADEAPVYGNISTVLKPGFTVNQSRKDLEESVYSNLDMAYPGKTGCSTDQSGTPENNCELYANTITSNQ